MNSAAAWIDARDETDRGNLLGAAVVAGQRDGRELSTIIEGRQESEAAIAAAREVGLLIVPDSGQVLPDGAHELALLERARAEGWRLLLLSQGADSEAQSGELAERLLAQLARTPGPPAPLPAPPGTLRGRVSVGNEDTFFRSGLMHVENFEACLAEADVALRESEALLDWGAGCGRMTVHLLAKAPRARVTAADTDAEAIGWVRNHLGVAGAVALPLLPPSDLEADSFDLVIGHSVFSHLALEAEERWLQELARIAKGGGHVAVSFNGPVALRWHLDHPLVEVPASVAAEVAETGFGIWTGDGWEEKFYDGYHTTFHTHEYVRERWSRWADVVAIQEAAALPTQDIAVLRVR